MFLVSERNRGVVGVCGGRVLVVVVMSLSVGGAWGALLLLVLLLLFLSIEPLHVRRIANPAT